MYLRRTLLGIAVSAASLAVISAFAQQPFPANKSIHIVVPFGPGGPVDVMARLLGDQMAKSLNTTVVIENRPGAGGNVGTAHVAKAVADGHTLLLATNSILTINEVIYPKLSYDPAKDLLPVSVVGEMPLILAVNPQLPATNVQELIDHVKKSGQPLTLSSPGSGTTPHLAAELFKREAGVPVLHVPYKGGAESATAIIGGQVMGGIETPPSVLPHVAADRMRALAVAGPERLDSLPDVPTTAEAGLPNVRIVPWFGLVAPVGTPSDVVEKLNQAVAQALRSPEVQERFAKLAIRPISSTSVEMAKRASDDREVWHKVVRDAGIRLE